MNTLEVVIKMAFLAFKKCKIPPNFCKMTAEIQNFCNILEILSHQMEKRLSKFEPYQFCYMSSNKKPLTLRFCYIFGPPEN